jgi:UDP-glucose:glycoprotein glucosyltransferase
VGKCWAVVAVIRPRSYDTRQTKVPQADFTWRFPTISPTTNSVPPKILPFDHIYPHSHSRSAGLGSHPPDVAILYISDLSPAQADLFEYLMRRRTKAVSNKDNDNGNENGDGGLFDIIVRYKPPVARPLDPESDSAKAQEESHLQVQDVNRRKNSLKGYGVEMVLKRTDYLAVDDRDTGSSPGVGAGQVEGESSGSMCAYVQEYGTRG